MSRSRLVVGLGAVFAGLTVFAAVLGFVYSPVAFVLAAPFGVTTYVLWYHASGRLRRRVYRRTSTVGPGWTERTRSETGGFGAEPRGEWTGPRSGGRSVGGGGRRTTPGRRRSGPTTAEAYRALDLEPGAGEAAVRTAYREKVKEVHPDADDGSERAFKRIQSAYDHLSD